jgi:CDP-glucose 4,6-dehydratase
LGYCQKVIKHYGCGNLQDCSNSTDVHEAKLLSLDISKAWFDLGWKPTLDIDQTIEFTVDWYKRYRTENVNEICVNQISKFVQMSS